MKILFALEIDTRTEQNYSSVWLEQEKWAYERIYKAIIEEKAIADGSTKHVKEGQKKNNNYFGRIKQIVQYSWSRIITYFIPFRN